MWENIVQAGNWDSSTEMLIKPMVCDYDLNIKGFISLFYAANLAFIYCVLVIKILVQVIKYSMKWDVIYCVSFKSTK